MNENVDTCEYSLDEDTSNSIFDNLLHIITEPNVKNEQDTTSIDKCKIISQCDSLCDQIFERYRIFLRNTYNQPLNRINHEWNVRDKKALHLDWMHNIKDYDNWIPPNIDDFRFHFYSNLPFSLQHVVQSTLQYPAIHIKILSDNIIDDWLPILTIHNKTTKTTKSVAKIILVNMKKHYKDNISSDDLQIRCDGLLSNNVKLTSPEITFEDLVEAIDICKYNSDPTCYLLAVKLVNSIELHNISDFIKQSIKELLLDNVSTNNVAIQISNCEVSNGHLPIKFIYSSTVDNILYPSHVASIVTQHQKIVIYPITRSSEAQFHLDYSRVITIDPPANHYFTDLSIPICLYGTLPMIYTVDTEPSLKLYQIYNEKDVKMILYINIPEELDKQSIGSYYKYSLKVDVNLRFPNLIAVGGITENIWVYDIIKVLGSKLSNHSKTIDIDYQKPMIITTGDLYHCIINPYLPSKVYTYFGNIHPIYKLNWIKGSDTLIGVQYGKFMRVPNGHNNDPSKHSVWAIWNIAKDVVNTDDAIMRNKYWIISSSVEVNKPVNNSRLVALYNGHFDSESGVLATDFKWNNQLGLLVASTDSTGQIHIVKPAIWSWCDCDDEFALARLEGDVNFFKNSLNHIKDLSTFCSEDSSMDSTRLRKTKARFTAIEKEAINELNTMENWMKNPLRLEYLPEWYRKQVTLPSDRDKAVYKFA